MLERQIVRSKTDPSRAESPKYGYPRPWRFTVMIPMKNELGDFGLLIMGPHPVEIGGGDQCWIKRRASSESTDDRKGRVGADVVVGRFPPFFGIPFGVVVTQPENDMEDLVGTGLMVFRIDLILQQPGAAVPRLVGDHDRRIVALERFRGLALSPGREGAFEGLPGHGRFSGRRRACPSTAGQG
jgi:hypothetical protein